MHLLKNLTQMVSLNYLEFSFRVSRERSTITVPYYNSVPVKEVYKNKDQYTFKTEHTQAENRRKLSIGFTYQDFEMGHCLKHLETPLHLQSSWKNQN